MIDWESVGKRVKMFRIRNKMSQEELAERVQISRIHIGYLERGERIPSVEVIVNVANALNVSADDILAENLLFADSIVSMDDIDFLADSTPQEYQILIRMMRYLKEILREYNL